MRSKTLRILSAFLLFWALVPALSGGCPCAIAAHEPHSGLTIQKIPCHGCCPETLSDLKTQNFERVEPAGFQLSGRHAGLNQSDQSAPAPKTPEPFLSVEEAPPPGAVPLYLALSIFRI